MHRDIGRIAERVARSVTGMSKKEQKVLAVVDIAKKARQDVDDARKSLLSVGRKVKYVDGVGTAVAEALTVLQEADLRMKDVVDRGNQFLGG